METTTERIFTGVLVNGEYVAREIPMRLPVDWAEDCPMPDREPLDFNDWNKASAQFTRDRLYERNAGLWLKERIKALADQADFTPSVALRELLAGYERKAAGL